MWVCESRASINSTFIKSLFLLFVIWNVVWFYLTHWNTDFYLCCCWLTAMKPLQLSIWYEWKLNCEKRYRHQRKLWLADRKVLAPQCVLSTRYRDQDYFQHSCWTDNSNVKVFWKLLRTVRVIAGISSECIQETTKHYELDVSIQLSCQNPTDTKQNLTLRKTNVFLCSKFDPNFSRQTLNRV